ncbi:hypothetical protein BO71DRAFT_68339 [Aspergillus ellipticus CBS 707.79]|uniref:Uncharacterized protein n=1 Tax=Aspergillus ellipticus CBS 707.79 TaxID=1448320 RepID=A0A319D130_9EURO|nr:hypothetical protein BO71DRAFT_68339 [Aspergillus ellipticus CBS 707.79]
MKLSLLTCITLLGLAMAAPAEQDTTNTGVTQSNDDTFTISYCGERCEHDRHCRRGGDRCHDCYKRHEGDRWGYCRRRYDDETA